MNFDKGIPLGRWFNVGVFMHWSFVLYAAFTVFPGGKFDPTQARWMAILFSSVLLHEFGHAFSCKWVGGKSERIVLWPLGGMAEVEPPFKPWAHLIVNSAGLVVNLVLCAAFFALYTYGIGDKGAGPIAQRIGPESPFIVGLTALSKDMIGVNLFLLLFNLIPAYPMDGGRMLQDILWMIVGYRFATIITGLVGAGLGIWFILVGLGLQKVVIPIINIPLGGPGNVNYFLVLFGALGIMSSVSMTVKAWKMQPEQQQQY